MFNRYGTIPDGAGQTDGRTICSSIYTLRYYTLCCAYRSAVKLSMSLRTLDAVYGDSWFFSYHAVKKATCCVVR